MSLAASADIRSLIHQKRWAELKTVLARLDPAEVAALFNQCPAPEQVLLYRSLPASLAADTFGFLDDAAQERLMKQMTEQETRSLLAELSPDDRTELFEEMPPETVRRLMELLSPQDRQESLMLLGYPEQSVGRLMSPDFGTVRPEWTVTEALDHLRHNTTESETLNIVYVVSPEGVLLDDLRLRRLVLSPPQTRVSELMNYQFSALSAFDPEEEAVRLMKQTGYFALPVTDRQGHLLGIVTADDVLTVAVEAATDDIHRSGAVEPLHTHLLRTPLGVLYRRRVSWLVILVFMNIFSGAGIAYYEHLVESVVALVFFLPLLIASGGNSGSQASTLLIRSMALGEVRLTDYLRVLWQEVRVSLALGVTMAGAVFLVAYWRSGTAVAQVVALSMVTVVLIGSIIGVSLPFVLQKLKLDPAAASSPLVTSLADIIGVLTYLGIASRMLQDLAAI